MSDSDDPVRAELMVACRHDVSDIIELVTDQMPEMTYMHDAEGWRTYYRFGAGIHPRDNYFLVVRLGGDGPLAGLAWVDAAAATDYGIAEPWWCINAVAVAKRFAGQGLGTNLVKMVIGQAEQVGVVSLYGVCYPQAAPFWRKVGFTVGELDAGLDATQPIRFLDGSTRSLTMDGEQGNHMFAVSLGDPEDGHARLLVP